MTLATFQRIYEINNTTPDTVERLGWAVCAVFGKTEEEVNNLPALKFLRLVSKIDRQLTAKPSRFFRVGLQTDARKITLGQFIECQYWLKSDAVQATDRVAASILLKRKDHAKDTERMKAAPFNRVLPKVQAFVLSMNAMIKSYSGLFEQEPEEEDNDQVKKDVVHPFIDQYGWIYSATQLAAYEGITLEKAFDLPIIQAFNGLAYLKSKAAYELIKNR